MGAEFLDIKQFFGCSSPFLSEDQYIICVLLNCVTPPQYKQCWKTSKWFHDGTKNIYFFFSLDIFNNYTLIFLVLTINTQLTAVYLFNTDKAY